MSYANFDEKIWLEFENCIKGLQERSLERVIRDHQKKALLNNNAVLIYLQIQNKFLGFGFFYFTKDEAVYASAVIDERAESKIPVGHLIQHEAINFCKKI